MIKKSDLKHNSIKIALELLIKKLKKKKKRSIILYIIKNSV